MTKFFNYYLIIGIALLLGSCGINSNIMFKSPKGEQVAADSIPMRPSEAYKISPDDKISFSMYANDGAQLLSQSADQQNRVVNNNTLEYLVRRDGTVEFPKLGPIVVGGLTVTECEDLLKELYAKEFIEPYVQVRITNQRVLLFPGNGGDAKVIPLVNNNTTLMECIAAAGGITDRGKANTVKLMRRVNGERQVYVLDLSTIDGLKHVDMIVQANDYIYVEPTPQLAKEITQEVAPVVSIISSAFVIVSLVNLIK